MHEMDKPNEQQASTDTNGQNKNRKIDGGNTPVGLQKTSTFSSITFASSFLDLFFCRSRIDHGRSGVVVARFVSFLCLVLILEDAINATTAATTTTTCVVFLCGRPRRYHRMAHFLFSLRSRRNRLSFELLNTQLPPAPLSHVPPSIFNLQPAIPILIRKSTHACYMPTTTSFFPPAVLVNAPSHCI